MILTASLNPAVDLNQKLCMLDPINNCKGQSEMLSNDRIRSIYNRAVAKVGEREAYEMFMDTYPEHETELNMLVLGQLEATAPSDAVVGLPEVDVAEAPDDEDPLDVAGLGGIDDRYNDPDDFAYFAFPYTPPDRTKAKVVKQKVAQPAAKGSSKTDRAVELYKSASDKSRKAIIDLFAKQLDMTAAGAATYYGIVRKKIG